MKKNYLPIGGALLVLLVILFYISPFSEVAPRTVCQPYEGVVSNPMYGEPIPLCGQVIWEKYASYLPLRMKETNGTRFCLDNLEKVKQACTLRVDEVLMEEGAVFLGCDYVQLEENYVRTVVSIRDVYKEYSQSGTDELVVSSWKSDNSRFNETCARMPLPGATSQ